MRILAAFAAQPYTVTTGETGSKVWGGGRGRGPTGKMGLQSYPVEADVVLVYDRPLSDPTTA